MSHDIIHYKEGDIAPINTLTWAQVETLLKAGYDPRFCGPATRAEDNITRGVTGDALALYESFAHLIWTMEQKKEIPITDKSPLPPSMIHLPAGRHVHGNLDFFLGEYAKHFSGDHASKEKAWASVEKVFSGNGFTDAVKAKVAEVVFESLENFVNKATQATNEDALVMVRANPSMAYADEDAYGGFGKRGNSKLEPAMFSKQVWTGFFEGGNQEEKAVRVKRAVHAMVTMASKAL